MNMNNKLASKDDIDENEYEDEYEDDNNEDDNGDNITTNINKKYSINITFDITKKEYIFENIDNTIDNITNENKLKKTVIHIVTIINRDHYSSGLISVSHSTNFLCVQIPTIMDHYIQGTYHYIYTYKNKIHNYYLYACDICEILLNISDYIGCIDSIQIKITFISIDRSTFSINTIMKYYKIRKYVHYYTNSDYIGILLYFDKIIVNLYYGYIGFSNIISSDYLFVKSCDITINKDITVLCKVYRAITAGGRVLYKVKFDTIYICGNIITLKHKTLYEHIKCLCRLKQLHYNYSDKIYLPNNITDQLEIYDYKRHSYQTYVYISKSYECE